MNDAKANETGKQANEIGEQLSTREVRFMQMK